MCRAGKMARLCKRRGLSRASMRQLWASTKIWKETIYIEQLRGEDALDESCPCLYGIARRRRSWAGGREFVPSKEPLRDQDKGLPSRERRPLLLVWLIRS